MAKVKTERMIVRDKNDQSNILDFKYDIYVSKEGLFSTTLPSNIVIKLKAANINVSKNRLDNEGYFSYNNLEKLEASIKAVCEEYFSRRITSEKIVIRYVIKTTCTYCLDVNGNIVPNAGREWTKFKERQPNDWKQGTEEQHATSPHPFGMEVYARPCYRREYKYKSGMKKTEYEEMTSFDHFPDKDEETKVYRDYLLSVCSMSQPDGGDLVEIEYNESTAKFFVDMIRGICLINEKIKQFAQPKEIINFLQAGGNFQLGK